VGRLKLTSAQANSDYRLVLATLRLPRQILCGLCLAFLPFHAVLFPSQCHFVCGLWHARVRVVEYCRALNWDWFSLEILTFRLAKLQSLVYILMIQ